VQIGARGRYIEWRDPIHKDQVLADFDADSLIRLVDDRRRGWLVDRGRSGDPLYDDAASLYGKLEQVILPLNTRDRSRWSWMMREAISKIPQQFNSQRMMRRYAAEACLR
jgi:hypothetical protein